MSRKPIHSGEPPPAGPCMVPDRRPDAIPGTPAWFEVCARRSSGMVNREALCPGHMKDRNAKLDRDEYNKKPLRGPRDDWD